jgi:hypothetical protein
MESKGWLFKLFRKYVQHGRLSGTYISLVKRELRVRMRVFSTLMQTIHILDDILAGLYLWFNAYHETVAKIQ